MGAALAAILPYLGEAGQALGTAFGSSGLGGAAAQVGSGALTGAEGALGAGGLGGALAQIGSGALNGLQSLATGNVMGLPAGLAGPPAPTAGLIGSGGQIGSGGILPQFGIGLGRAEFGLPPQNVGFNPQTLGALLGGLPTGGGQNDARGQQQVALLMQLLQNLRRQGIG